MTTDPQAALDGALAGLPDRISPLRLGLAVSGGGDSIALLHLARDWAVRHGVTLAAATVDHGLRPEARAEALDVATRCAGLGIGHSILYWRNPDLTGNLQDVARQARRRLLAGWADTLRLDAVLLGHTADDQAETVLMRLARGSGVDGLAGMGPTDATGLFLRPLLQVTRASLRDWLTARGIEWAEDPSNDDTRFDRVKARQAMALLAPLGLTQDRLIATAGHMARAQRALWEQAAAFAAARMRAVAGDLILDAAALRLDRSDTEGRVLAAAVQWIGASPYRPRHEALRAAAAALARGEARTLGGVVMLPDGLGGARLLREAAAVAGPHPASGTSGTGHLWDGRWMVERNAGAPPLPPGPLHIAALGEAGLAECKAWRDTGLPRASLVTTPAIRAGDDLIGAPLAGWPNGWSARLSPSFDRFILSH